ncbi:MAG: FlgD immunoglobulin-like domain containing protein, partial [Calditrichota bacterium]
RNVTLVSHLLDDSFGIAAGHDGIVLRTEDAGNIWQEFTLPGEPRINRLINYHNFWGDSTVGAFGDNGSGFHGLKFGSVWTPVSTGTTSDLLGGAVCPNGDIYVSGAEGTLLKSTNRGFNWQSVVINTTASLASIGFFASGAGLIGADYGMVFRTNGCGDPWEQLQPQVVRSTLLAIYFITLLKGWAVGADGNILATVDGGATWVKQTDGIPGFINDIHFIDENKGFAVGGVFNSSATVLRTDDGGANWTSVNTPAFNTLFDVHFIDSQIGFICGVDGQLYYTFNCGATWQTLFSGTSNWLLDIEFTSASTGYIVGGNGTIIKSENGGTLWIPLSSGTQDWLQGISFLDDSIGVAVGNNERILRTTDAGLTWEDRTLNTPRNRSYSSVDMSAFLLKDGGQEAQGIAVGSDGALLFTQDGGLNWQEQQSGTGNDLFDLALLSDGSAYLCGEGGTILYSPSVTVGVEPLEATYISDDFQLRQNFPNPFNPETTIQFELSAAGNFQLVIFDVLGRRVRELVNENLASGSFQVRWDGRDDLGREVSSGIYVYQLIGKGVAVSRKMMLLR